MLKPPKSGLDWENLGGLCESFNGLLTEPGGILRARKCCGALQCPLVEKRSDSCTSLFLSPGGKYPPKESSVRLAAGLR